MDSAQRIIILVDISNTLADFTAKLVSTYRKRHPGEPYVDKDESSDYHMADEYKRKISQKAGEEIREIFHERGFFTSLSPLPYAITALNEMLDNGFEVFICTSSLKQFEHCVNEKYHWILDHMGKGCMTA